MTTLERSRRVEHHADEPLRRHDRVELGRPPSRAPDVEQQGPAVGGLGLVQHLGGDVRVRRPAAERQELAEPLVLGDAATGVPWAR